MKFEMNLLPGFLMALGMSLLPLKAHAFENDLGLNSQVSSDYTYSDSTYPDSTYSDSPDDEEFIVNEDFNSVTDPDRDRDERNRPHRGRVFPPFHHRGGHFPWPRWRHAPFRRPDYFWRWNFVQTVTCTAQDSWGNQYPVTEHALGRMDRFRSRNQIEEIQDAALDRCYFESRGDRGCMLLYCRPGYRPQ